MCVADAGCLHTPAAGFDSVTCVCQREEVVECPSVPALIEKRRARSCTLFDQGARASDVKKAKRRLRAALRALRVAENATVRAAKNKKITANCAVALEAAVGDAGSRARELLGSL